MTTELRPIVTVLAGGVPLRSKSVSWTQEAGNPSQATIVLDNSQGDYDPSAAIAFPQTYSTPLTIRVDDGTSVWNSPELLVDDYDYDTDLVTLTCFDRLSQLDIEDQVMSDLQDTTVSSGLTSIGGAYGLTFNGSPSRNLTGPYHRIGVPLQWVSELLQPAQDFYMGSGSTVEVFSVSTNGASISVADNELLEDVTLRRTRRIYNKATVERLVPESGRTILFEESRSDGSSLGLQGPFNLSEPSRALTFVKKFGERGFINSIVLLDSGGSPINTLPLNQITYIGTTPVHSFRFSYDLDPNANTWGAWTPNWSVKIEGLPLTSNPIPTEGFSVTQTAGAGDKPYPEPFSTLILEDEAAATAAALALATVGNRQGTVMNCSYRLKSAKVPVPNSALIITDYKSGLAAVEFTVESVTITADEEGDTGTISVEGTRSE